MRPLQGSVSVHDVMPDTLDAVARIVTRVHGHGLPPPTLLVVPGLAWQPEHIEQLRAWAASGYPLAAHGWLHRARDVRGVRHRLHSVMLSRDAAEHMALSTEQICAVMRRAFQWFEHNDLPRPELYVPPAWAIGDIRPAQLAWLPFARIEVTAGMLDARSGRMEYLPLVGYEADTRSRAIALTAWNRGQVTLARRSGRRLRVGIHPNDFRLRMRDDLDRMLETLAREQAHDAQRTGMASAGRAS